VVLPVAPGARLSVVAPSAPVHQLGTEEARMKLFAAQAFITKFPTLTL
jgi:hypothetical protein